jgi:hypothetical protein
MGFEMKHYMRVVWQGFIETKVEYQRYCKLCKEGQGWLVMHLAIGPEGRVSEGDRDLQIRRSRTNQCKREGPRVDQDSFRAQVAFSALAYVLFCCQVLIAVKLTSKIWP